MYSHNSTIKVRAHIENVFSKIFTISKYNFNISNFTHYGNAKGFRRIKIFRFKLTTRFKKRIKPW